MPNAMKTRRGTFLGKVLDFVRASGGGVSGDDIADAWSGRGRDRKPWPKVKTLLRHLVSTGRLNTFDKNGRLWYRLPPDWAGVPADGQWHIWIASSARLRFGTLCVEAYPSGHERADYVIREEGVTGPVRCPGFTRRDCHGLWEAKACGAEELLALLARRALIAGRSPT